MPVAAGIGLALSHGGPPRTSSARIVLSNATIAENAAIGDLIGTLAVASGAGSYTFALTADPDEKFALDGNALELDATLDHATAATHTVTVEADNGLDLPLSRTFTITVTAVSGLVAITLDQIPEGRTFQRTVNGDGSFETIGPVAIGGSTTGQASAIEARVLLEADDSVVLDWTVIDPAPAAESFAGTLTVPQGGPYYLEVRDAAETAIGDAGTTSFKLGLLAIGLDQSNMAGMFRTFSSPPSLDPLGGWFDEYEHVWTNTPPGNGVRTLMNAFVAGSGVPVAVGNPAVGGAAMGYFIEGEDGWEGLGVPADGNAYRVGVRPLIEMMGGDIEIVFLRGGEGEANAPGPTPLDKKTTFKTDTVTVRDQIEALVGHPVTVIMGSLMTTTVVGGTTDDAWSAMDAALYELSQNEDRFILSASTKDSQRVDEYHADGASHGEVGKRFGHSLLVYNGDEMAHPAWHIAAAEIIDANHTRLTLAHAMGDDFTPATDITDIKVTGDNGANWLAGVGEREDATHIVVAHDTLTTSNNRSIRFQHGMVLAFDPGDTTLKNPVLDGMVRDNSVLTVPLFPSAGRSIVAAGFAADPTPTWVQALSGAFGGGGGGQDQQWTGVDLSAAQGKKVHMSFVRFDSGAFADVSSVTVTPSGGSPITVSPIAVIDDDGTGTERWAGLTATIPSVANLDDCTVDLHYTANPFGGTWVGVWIVPDEVAVVAAVYAGGVVSPAAPHVASVDLETEAGGFICASYAPSPAASTESGVLTATWDGDTPGPANRFNYDSFFSNQRSMADVSGTEAAPDTTITATFAGIDDVAAYRLLAVSFR